MGANIAGDTIQQVAGRGRLASSLLPMHQPSIDESEAMPPPLFTSLLVYSPTCGLCCSVLLWVGVGEVGRGGRVGSEEGGLRF